jgi:hypothetical protein
VPSTYSNLKIQLMATGENTGTWGNVTNENLGTALEQAIVETATVTFASANQTLTLTDSNAKQDARALRLDLTGTTGGARDLIVPAIQKPYLVNNGTADTITVKVSGQTGIAVPAGKSMLLYNNGTDVGLAFNRVVADVVGNVTGNVTGTASNATVLQTARNIQISGNVTAANVSFDGSAAVNLDVTAINAAGITSGTLGVARGGTGATTLNAEAVVIGNTTGAVKFVDPGTANNVLTSNGTAWVSQAVSAGGNYVMQVYDSSPATWDKPAGLKAVKVTVIGGGGGSPQPATGGTSSFGSFCSATGGAGGGLPFGCNPTSPTAPGLGSGGSLNGGGIAMVSLNSLTGDHSILGYGGTGTPSTPATPYKRNPIYGGGAFGANSVAGDGAGAGGYAIEYIPAPSIPGPVTVTVGAGATAAPVSPVPAPTFPLRNARRQNGGTGLVIVEEFY